MYKNICIKYIKINMHLYIICLHYTVHLSARVAIYIWRINAVGNRYAI